MTTFTVRLTIARSAGNVSPFRKVRFPSKRRCRKEGNRETHRTSLLVIWTPAGFFIFEKEDSCCKRNIACSFFVS